MAFNGSGVFNRLFSWATDKTNSVPVTASRMDSEMDGFATGLSTCIAKDGQTTTTARIPFALGVQWAVGAVGSPSAVFSGDTDTGIYSPGADQVAIAAAGTQRFLVNAGAISVTGTFAVSGATTLSSTLGVTGVLSHADGTAGAPSIAFTSDSNTGAYSVGADRFGISCGGTLIGDWTTGGVNVTGQVNCTGNVAVNTNKFNITAASGNTAIAGIIDVTGAATLRAGLTLIGAATISTTLSVSGVTTLAAGSTMGGNAITNFPAGTAMVFQQTSAPTGWTKGATHNDKALRVVTGTASSGGSTAFTTVFASRTIAQGNLPNYNLSLASVTATDSGHTHAMAGTINSTNTTGTTGNNFVTSNTSTGTQAFTSLAAAAPASSTANITVGGTLPSGGSGTAMDFAVNYVDVIIATKD